jgi:hypothetical protein
MKRIYEKDEINDLILNQVITVLFRFEMILSNADTSTIIRVKLYELLSILIRLDYKEINEALAKQEILLACIINDFDRFDNNSNVLSILVEIVEDITQ